MIPHNEVPYGRVDQTQTERHCGARLPLLVAAMACATALAGCVNVSAPDKPIVIELNINIKQEVVYRLDGDAKALIEQEAEIF